MKDKNLESEKSIEPEVKYIAPSMKQVLIMIAVLVCCAFGFVAVCALEDARVWETEDIALTENSGVSCSIDKLTMGDIITFDSCYAEVPGEYISSWDVTIVLRSPDEANGLYIPTYMADSATDINTYHKNEGNYVRTAFLANVKADKLSLDSTDYDILIYYNNNGKGIYIDTGRDLTKEGLR